ncbi:MAG: O-antigen polysaccharide polymerase Wzy [Coriobacteriales bacterium]|jgi:oligosaccharide repeat unit polymerase|nr:O-antigen polysaccharide polymerase Wzy [Coriobacteriales bacterium]
MRLIGCLYRLLMPLSALLFLTGWGFGDLTLMFVGVAALYVANLAFAIERIDKRFLFLYFHLALFLFLLSRPTIALLRGRSIQYVSVTYPAAVFTLTALFITLLLLLIGMVFVEYLLARLESRRAGQGGRVGWWSGGLLRLRAGGRTDVRPYAGTRDASRSSGIVAFLDNPKLPTIRFVSGLLFLLSFAGTMYFGYLQIQAMGGLDYVYFYLTEQSADAPLVVRTLATIEPYALCAYLATLPRKHPATGALILHVLTTGPSLIIGARGGFVLAILFAILYYAYREFTDGRGVWIGKLEKTLLVVGIPAGIIVMGLQDYLRTHTQTATSSSVIDSLLNALYQQGTTYGVLGRGYQAQERIAQLGDKLYTFGDLLNYLEYGPLGSLFFSGDSLPGYNSVIQATQGNTYSHALSYFMHPDYLAGHGYGSSYLLEAYQDFGMVGIVVFSGGLGTLLGFLPWWFTRSWLPATISLTISTLVFHVPRGAAMEWINFIWTPQFWVAIVLICCGAALLRTKAFMGLAGLSGLSGPAGPSGLSGLSGPAGPAGPSGLVHRNKGETYGTLDGNRDLRRLARNDQKADRSHPAYRRPLRWLGTRAGSA